MDFNTVMLLVGAAVLTLVVACLIASRPDYVIEAYITHAFCGGPAKRYFVYKTVAPFGRFFTPEYCSYSRKACEDWIKRAIELKNAPDDTESDL